KPPVTVVIGKVVDLVKKLDWISKEPLRGTRILVTRGRSQASYLSDMLLEKGAELLEIPTIEIYPLPIDQRVKGCLTNLGQYEWVVFSSVNAVELFMMALVSSRIAPASLKKIRIACVGEATAKSLEPFGLKASLVPKDYKQEGLVKAFKRLPLKGKRFFLARGKEGRDLFLKFLQKKGALVDSWALYENRVPPDTRRKLSNLFLKEGGVDLVTFASSSAADHFYCLFTSDQRANWLKDLPVGVIGPVTAATVRKWGGKIAVQPKKYTLPALVEACEQWARKRKTGNF
ncbi:MAG TPA: uroporphyrinogen-III synthase, partial [bacterium]